MSKTKNADSKVLFSAVEKAKEKAIRESYHFKDSHAQHPKHAITRSGSYRIKLTVKK